MNDQDLLKRVYQAFSPLPLRKGQESLYVPLDAVRGHTSIVKNLSRKIRLAAGPTCNVIAGHRGSGKSTELDRLRKELDSPVDPDSGRYFVVHIRADDRLDRNDVDFPEILLALIGEVATKLREDLGIELRSSYLAARWQAVKGLALSEVDFDKLELAAGALKMSAAIKQSPVARTIVRRALEPDTTNLIEEANRILGDAHADLTRLGYFGLVVLFDDLDKMVARKHDSADCLTTEYLFVHRSGQLSAFNCHLVYTIPIELAYSHHESELKRLYGGSLQIVPMTKVMEPPPSDQVFDEGVDRFKQIIGARLASVGAEARDLFANLDIERRLVLWTGGQPTELMTTIREAMVADGLPIAEPGLRRAEVEAERGYRRQLVASDWPVIEQVRANGQVARTDELDKSFLELLGSRAILLYRNDEEWYRLHPAVQRLEPPMGT